MLTTNFVTILMESLLQKQTKFLLIVDISPVSRVVVPLICVATVKLHQIDQVM